MHKHHISTSSFHIKMLRFYYQMFASSNDIVTYIIKLACVSGNSQLFNATQQGLVNAVFDLYVR